MCPEMWIADLFASRVTDDDTVIRLKVRDIDRYVGRERFLHEVERYGYHAIEKAGQMIVVCDRKPIHALM